MAYDDFEDTTLDAWTEVTTAGGSAANSTSAAKFGARGMRFTSDGAGDSAQAKYQNNDAATSGAWNFYFWFRTSNIAKTFYYVGSNVTATAFTFGCVGSKFVAGHKLGNPEFTEVPVVNTWYRCRITYDGVSAYNFNLYDSDGAWIEEVIGTAADDADIVSIALDSRDNLGSVVTEDLDNVCITDTDEPAAAGGATMNMRKFW